MEREGVEGGLCRACMGGRMQTRRNVGATGAQTAERRGLPTCIVWRVSRGAVQTLVFALHWKARLYCDSRRTHLTLRCTKQAALTHHGSAVCPTVALHRRRRRRRLTLRDPPLLCLAAALRERSPVARSEPIARLLFELSVVFLDHLGYRLPFERAVIVLD